MLNDRRPFRSGRSPSAVGLFLSLVPFMVVACISVSNEGQVGATPIADPSAAQPVGSATLATPTPRPTPEPTPEPVDAEVVGFLPGWLVEDAAEAIDSDLLTVLALHSIEASGDGKLVAKKPSGDVPPGWKALESDAFAELKDELQAEGVKVVPVVQRVGWTEGTARRTETLLSKPKNRRSLATRIASFVEDRGFDGVNLDFEPIPEALSDEYVELVREVRTALDEVDPELHLSVDVVAGLGGYDLEALTADDAADLAVIMGYNYRTDGAKVAGSTAPLDDPGGNSLSSTVTAALTQVAPERLVLALPWYGRAWSTETDQARSPTVSGKDIDAPSEPYYAAAVAFAAVHGRRYQPEQASAWTAYPDQKCTSCPATWRQVWYDDPDSFRAKIDLALEQDLAGIGIWALGMESGREDMWLALRDRLRPRIDVSAPGGSAALKPDALQGDLDGRDVVKGSAPLLLFANDDISGSGLVLARVGLDGEVDGKGRLLTGRSYPAEERTELTFPLADESTGGSAEDGPRSIHVQWRDLAGNWSMPIVVEAYVIDPKASQTPADLER